VIERGVSTPVHRSSPHVVAGASIGQYLQAINSLMAAN
jgi:hypothetical protein